MAGKYTLKKIGPADFKGYVPRIATVSQLVDVVRPYFLSSSLSQPPKANPSKTGNRVIALTTQTGVQSVNGQNGHVIVTTRPTDTKAIALIAGSLSWSFTTQFQNAPVVSFSPVAVPPSAGTTLYIFSVSNTAVIVKSTDATDTRLVYLLATGNPN